MDNRVHEGETEGIAKQRVTVVKGSMPRPKAHYSVVVKDHVSGRQMKVELVDLPFSEGRRFRVRVNGEWARKVPVASKSLVVRQVRRWLVRH